jgi:hypothetical protein
MYNYWQNIDLKVLFLAFLFCYLIPELLVGTLLIAIASPSGEEPKWAAGSLIVFSVVAPPLAGGYFTARYSRALPQLHTFLVTVIGALALWVITGKSWGVFAVCASLSVMLNVLGAYLWLRRAPRIPLN